MGIVLLGVVGVGCLPAVREWWLGTARLAELRGDPSEALRRARWLLRLDGSDEEAARIAARCLSRMRRLDEAEVYYEVVRARSDLTPDDRWSRALGLLHAGRFGEVRAEAMDLTQLPRGAARGFALVAIVHNQMGEHAMAVSSGRNVENLDPELYELEDLRERFVLEYADALIWEDEPDRARDLLSEECRRHGSADLFDLLGRACLASGDANGAELAWRSSLFSAPDRIGPRNWLAGLLLQGNRKAEALKELEAASVIDPEDYEALSGLARVHKLLGHDDQAGKFEGRAEAARRRLPPSETGMGSMPARPLSSKK